MTIRPISSVSFNNNLSFEAKKSKRNDNNHSSNPISHKLAVPLAATILAMTPAPVNSQNVNNERVDKIENVENKKFPLGKVVAQQAFDYENGKTCLISYESTDGNDSDAELVRLVFNNKVFDSKNINGEKVNYKIIYLDEIYVEGFEDVEVTRKYKQKSDDISHEYFVVGARKYSKDPGIATDGSYKVVDNSHFEKYYEKSKLNISPSLYNYLSELLKNDVNCTKNSKEIDGDAEIPIDEYILY